MSGKRSPRACGGASPVPVHLLKLRTARHHECADQSTIQSAFPLPPRRCGRTRPTELPACARTRPWEGLAACETSARRDGFSTFSNIPAVEYTVQLLIRRLASIYW